MEPDAAVWLAAPRPVFEIPFNMEPAPGKLRPYLVMPSGNEFDVKKKVMPPPAKQPVSEQGFFETRTRPVTGGGLVPLRIKAQPVDKLARFWEGHSVRRRFNNGPVVLFHRAGLRARRVRGGGGAKNAVQKAKGGPGQGKDRTARYGNIKAVDRRREGQPVMRGRSRICT